MQFTAIQPGRNPLKPSPMMRLINIDKFKLAAQFEGPRLWSPA